MKCEEAVKFLRDPVQVIHNPVMADMARNELLCQIYEWLAEASNPPMLLSGLDPVEDEL